MLQQPGSFAWQVFDAQVKPLLRDEYKLRGATKVHGRHARRARRQACRTSIRAVSQDRARYNAAIKRDVPFDPNVKDGRRTVGLAIDKTNWANALEKPPFEAYSVGCGITFTFGGLKIDTTGRVLDIEDAPIPGFMRRANWSAGSSTSTIRAAPG